MIPLETELTFAIMVASSIRCSQCDDEKVILSCSFILALPHFLQGQSCIFRLGAVTSIIMQNNLEERKIRYLFLNFWLFTYEDFKLSHLLEVEADETSLDLDDES
ncbi:hypothetical protein AVEN_93674-1 [Araneus ventricosus]|uniref:Uncharacterized protein n=1 Tax=Araneus ventricosus TaxID=182803 RepID=A0A4Y2NTJ7_ARAVE|nr:hypothetical protein AVEN_93674-1 [Araneus ventricosus]